MRRPSRMAFLVGFAVVALLVAAGLSYLASASPDGLERVATDLGFADRAAEHAAAGSPFADYQTRVVDEPLLSGGLAGIAGVAVTAALGGALFFVVRRKPDA